MPTSRVVQARSSVPCRIDGAEWIGGRISFPAYVSEGEPYRPDGPWEHNPGLAEHEDASTVRCTMTISLPMHVARREQGALATIDFVSRSLNEHIPALEGTLSELVKSDEGRPKVEQWLREAELRGHSDPSRAYLDLDSLRCELGLPPVGRAPAADRLEGLPKMSATLIEFAQPLLDELSTADDIEELRVVMTIATLAWNLPVYERRNAPEAPACRAAFEDLMAQGPRPIAKHLDAMARARLTMYAHDPRLAFVEVADQCNGRANIQATAVLFPDGG